MTPQNAERALYSDIFNLSVATREYKLFKKILNKVAKTHEVEDLLHSILDDNEAREKLIEELCRNECVTDISDYLMTLDSQNSRGTINQRSSAKRK